MLRIQRAEALAELRRNTLEGGRAAQAPNWDGIVAELQFGAITERVFWAVHERILQAKRSAVRIPDVWLAHRVWGARRPPQHWLTDASPVRSIVSAGCTWAQVREADPPAFGTETALLTHTADLRCSQNDQCDEDCPLAGGPPHHHFLVNIGRGFLGILERCVTRAEGGVRYYEFPARGSRRTGPNLSRLWSNRPVDLPVSAGTPGKPSVVRCVHAVPAPTPPGPRPRAYTHAARSGERTSRKSK